jgi:hypothetical protein
VSSFVMVGKALYSFSPPLHNLRHDILFLLGGGARRSLLPTFLSSLPSRCGDLTTMFRSEQIPNHMIVQATSSISYSQTLPAA